MILLIVDSAGPLTGEQACIRIVHRTSCSYFAPLAPAVDALQLPGSTECQQATASVSAAEGCDWLLDTFCQVEKILSHS